MCLNTVIPPKHSYGVGYKIVRKISDTEFVPEYPYFTTNGTGGSNEPSSNTVPANCVYKLGKEYIVNHARIARSFYYPCKKYRAGVHLFKRNPGRGYHNQVTVKFRYKQAVATDGNVIVALSVTPIKVM